MIPSKLTIEEVEAQFTTWRSSKKFNSPAPIPESLCSQVRTLLQTYPRIEVLRRCGLTLHQARKKGLLPSLPSTLDDKKLNSFVKIPMSPSTYEKATILNLRCGDRHLSLENPTDEQVRFIIGSLLG